MVGFPSGQREQTVNLPSTTSVVRIHPPPLREGRQAGVAQLVELQPSKLDVVGSSPIARSNRIVSCPRGSVVEHVLGKDGVASSILAVGSSRTDTLINETNRATREAKRAQSDGQGEIRTQ